MPLDLTRWSRALSDRESEEPMSAPVTTGCLPTCDWAHDPNCPSLRASREKPGGRPPGRAAFYACLYPMLVEVGREHGYAVALHGSLARDLDLIATPWVENYSAPDDFVKDVAKRVGAIAGDDLVVVWPNDPRSKPKPHGRLVYTVVLEGGAFIDLSVIPPRSRRCGATMVTPTPSDIEWRIRCDLSEGHAGQHISDEGGMLWSDVEPFRGPPIPEKVGPTPEAIGG